MTHLIYPLPCSVPDEAAPVDHATLLANPRDGLGFVGLKLTEPLRGHTIRRADKGDYRRARSDLEGGEGLDLAGGHAR